MRACVIFNPVAKGEKARQFRATLDVIAHECELKKTTAPGDGRRLAAEAIREGFEFIIAAGGDGTLNEVLNGLGDVPDGFQRACLGVLPLGTVNVFARELKIPLHIDAAWKVIRRQRESRIDLPCAEFAVHGRTERRYFAQLAGAGLDARAIELVSWPLKKKIGPFAYIVAGLKALTEKHPIITITSGDTTYSGGLMLIGNGRLYGGNYAVHAKADLRDGLLDVCVFPRVGWGTLARCAFPLLARGRLPEKLVRRFQAAEFTLSSTTPMAFELEGDLAGQLPVKFFVQRQGLRVLVP